MTKFESCRWIEYGLEFSNDRLRACCYGENEGGGRPQLTSRNDYRGELLNYPEIFKAKKLPRFPRNP